MQISTVPKGDKGRRSMSRRVPMRALRQSAALHGTASAVHGAGRRVISICIVRSTGANLCQP